MVSRRRGRPAAVNGRVPNNTYRADHVVPEQAGPATANLSPNDFADATNADLAKLKVTYPEVVNSSDELIAKYEHEIQTI